MTTSHITASIDENAFRTEIRLSIGRGFPLATDRAEVRAEAQAIAAEFPKYVKATATTLSTYQIADDGEHCSFMQPHLVIQATTKANGVNGGVNESGLKRIAAARKTLDRLGIEVVS